MSEGEIFGLIGHNGAGKTTTINMLTGLIQPTTGTAKICGYDIIEEPIEARRKIGLLPDNSGNYLNLTAAQNLTYFSKLADIPPNKINNQITELLDLVGLSNWRNTKVAKFSRGMKQRLGIAQSLLRDPDILFYDEPTLGLDPDGTRIIRELILDLSKNKDKTIVLTTHLLHEANRMCDRVAIMKNGAIIAIGSINELKTNLNTEANLDLEGIYNAYQGRRN